MEIDHDIPLEIHIVCPNHEDLYVSRTKESFHDEKLINIKLDSNTTLKPSELKSSWSHTQLFVIRSKSSWNEQIKAYLSATPGS
jgi:hypothetical protein